MFTGIIKGIGAVKSFERSASALCGLAVQGVGLFDDAAIGDSIAVNGVCLTVTKKAGDIAYFDVMQETVRVSNLGSLRSGDRVNLEPALKAGDPISGHIVQGHVDCLGIVKRFDKGGTESVMEVEHEERFCGLTVHKGSIALDGVSLTIAQAGDRSFTVCLIPHTLSSTAIGSRRRGDKVNLEFDIIGKYVRRNSGTGKTGITEDFLRRTGFEV